MNKFIRDLELQTLNKTNQQRADVAIDNIETAFDQLVSSPHLEDMTIRNVATKSGYSIGSIYRYFPKIDYLFINYFLKRMVSYKKEAIALIESHQPDQDIHTFLTRYIDFLFSRFYDQGSPRVKRMVIRYILKNSDHPERFTTIADDMLIHFKAIADHDLTGTFRKMDETELFFCLRALQGVIRTVMVEGGSLSGSKMHKHFSLIVAMRIFATDYVPAHQQNEKF